MGENLKRVNVMLDPATIERLKDAAVAIGSESVSSLLEKAANVYLADLESARREPFPARGDALRVGRRRNAAS